MTKAELIEKMAADASIPKNAAAKALESLLASVKKGVKKKNGRLLLTGFGTFYKKRQKARMCRNPNTGEPMQVKAHNVVKFRPGRKLKALDY